MERTIRSDAAPYTAKQRKKSAEQGRETAINPRRESKGNLPPPPIHKEEVSGKVLNQQVKNDNLDSPEYLRNEDDPGVVPKLNQVKLGQSETRDGMSHSVEEIEKDTTVNRRRDPNVPTPPSHQGEACGKISNEEIFGKFYEQIKYSSLDSLEYPRNGDDPGLVLILNQVEFVQLETRDGSKKDVEDIVTCFGRLGFNIKKEHIFEDCSKDELFQGIDKVLESNLTYINSVLVFVLSHGEYSNAIHARQESYKLEDILAKFQGCKALKGKPKMFVIQACKGDATTVIRKDSEEVKPLVPLSTFDGLYPDMIIIYSTMEGKYSFRDINRGSWLIQEICRNFTAYGRRDDVLTLSSRVIKCICTNYYNTEPTSKDVEKQIPVVVSTLSKKFYLNRNKDRNYANKSLEMMETILDTLKEIYRGFESTP